MDYQNVFFIIFISSVIVSIIAFGILAIRVLCFDIDFCTKLNKTLLAITGISILLMLIMQSFLTIGVFTDKKAINDNDFICKQKMQIERE